ncbi:MAG: hypothetical protein ACLVAW_07735 [Eisenbergiella massiliensis]
MESGLFGGYCASRQAFMALLMNSEAPGPYILSLASIYAPISVPLFDSSVRVINPAVISRIRDLWDPQ